MKQECSLPEMKYRGDRQVTVKGYCWLHDQRECNTYVSCIFVSEVSLRGDKNLGGVKECEFTRVGCWILLR